MRRGRALARCFSPGRQPSFAAEKTSRADRFGSPLVAVGLVRSSMLR